MPSFSTTYCSVSRAFMPYLYAFGCIFGLWSTIIANVSAQTAGNCPPSMRYQKQVFAQISVTKDITFGNADRYDVLNTNNPQPIKLDVYQPVGDTLSRRPALLFFFGGAFVLGDKGDADVKAWCDSVAHYGYVGVAVNYRLGFDPLSSGSAVRAVYRAVQDARGAIRFLKHNAALYHLDTTRIYIGGESAGAITALQTAFLTDNTERPQDTYGITTENTDLHDLDADVNTYPNTATVAGVISLWGAMYREKYITAAKKIPTLLIHGTADAIVPFESGHPFTGSIPSTFPIVFGSHPTHLHMDSVGVYNEFYPYVGQGHVFYGLPTGVVTFPNQYWDSVWTQGHNFLYHTLQFATPTIIGNTHPDHFTNYTYSVAAHIGSNYCWKIVGGQIIAGQGTNTVTVQWSNTTGTLTATETNYLLVTGAPSSLTVSVVNATASLSPTLSLRVFPNPAAIDASLTVVLESTANQTPAAIAKVQLFNAIGQVVLSIPAAQITNTNTARINTAALPRGFYTVGVETAAGEWTLVKVVLE